MSAVDDLRDRLTARYQVVAEVAADLFVDRTRAEESRRTGAMWDATGHGPISASGGTITVEAFVDVDYAAGQDTGTGIYGPTGQRIFPTSAKALRFDWPAAGGIVFAKSVAGAPGRHFWADKIGERWQDAVGDALAAVPL